MEHKVDPLLYRLGDPNKGAPVFVTANFTLSSETEVISVKSSNVDNMPELPEVELERRYIERNGLHRRIRAVSVKDQGILDGVTGSELRAALKGYVLDGAERHGKQLIFSLNSGGWLTIHLGMTGGLHILDQGQDLPLYTRLVVRFLDGSFLVMEDLRKFGAVGLARSKAEIISRKGLGPDALEIDLETFRERVSKHHRAIKTVLLDQSVLAGVGNLYSDEVLFQCRVHPLVKADQLSDVQLLCLHGAIRDILQRSIDLGTDFDLLPEGYLLRERQLGSLCPRGHGRLDVLRVNGRTSYLCPECQRP